MPAYTKQEIRAALEKTKGMKFLASLALGCSHTTISAWLKKCPDLEAWRQTLDGGNTDTAELKLHEKILAGEAWAVQFQLRTKGKDRGYGDAQRLELSGDDEHPIRTINTIEINRLPRP